MYVLTDTHRALQAVERLQVKLRERGDTANEEKLGFLKSVLQSPLFNQILNLQASLPQPRDQVGQQHLWDKENATKTLSSFSVTLSRQNGC